MQGVTLYFKSCETNVFDVQATNTQLEENLQEALMKCEKVEKELADVRQLYQSRQQEVDSVDAQARAEKKVYNSQIFVAFYLESHCIATKR